MTTNVEPLEEALAKQIKVELAESGMDQKELAGKVGVHPVTMTKYMTFARSIPMPVFFSIAEALGLSPRELMARAEARIARPEAQTA